MRGVTPNDEAERFAQAEREYKDRSFAEASALFRSLAEDFRQSGQRGNYQFMAQLCQLRDAIHKIQMDAETALTTRENLDSFLKIYEPDPIIKPHRDAIAESMYKLVGELGRLSETTLSSDLTKAETLLAAAKNLNDYASKHFAPAPPEQAKALHDSFAAAARKMDKARSRCAVLRELERLLDEPSFAGLETARLLVETAGITDDPDVKSRLAALPERHVKSIVFSAEFARESVRVVPSDLAPSFALVSQRGPIMLQPSNAGKRPVLALVRGVLYAFDPGNGSMRWRRRVGVDTTALPIWLPATPLLPSMVVLAASEATEPSADEPQEGKRVPGLLALKSENGTPLWCQVLPDAGVGQPLPVDGRLLMACRDGTVLEVEIASGACLGGYQLGEELTTNGVRQPGTNLVYFMAAHGGVFALDVVERQCRAVLYTGHAGGSARCPPIIVPMNLEEADRDKGGQQSAQLLICLEDGKGRTKLSRYALAIIDPKAEALPVGVSDQDSSLLGRIWHAPLRDAERISFVTDAGVFAVYGVQPRATRRLFCSCTGKKKSPSQNWRAETDPWLYMAIARTPGFSSAVGCIDIRPEFPLKQVGK